MGRRTVPVAVRRRFARRSAFPALVVAAVLAAACSGGDGVTPAGTPAATTAGPDGATNAAPATTAPAATTATVAAPAATSTSTAGAAAPTTGAGSTAGTAAGRPVLRFTEPASVAGWLSVDDTVMGGRSDSTVRWADGALLFSGVVSLENNGGFSSVRSPFDPAIGAALAGATELVVEATGDGKTYVLQLRSGPSAQALHIARFTTTAGQAKAHVLPLAGFEAVGFRLDPRPSAPPVDPATVVQLSLYVLDKQAGPFSLSLRSILAR